METLTKALKYFTVLALLIYVTSPVQEIPAQPIANQSIAPQIGARQQVISKDQQVISKDQQRIHTLTTSVVTAHKVDWNLAHNVVETAIRHERHDFPKAEDILSIISVESKFDPSAKSAGNIGLAQVNYKTWKSQITKRELYTVEGSVRQSANILDLYYRESGSKTGAVMAYNVGITAYKKGARPRYYYNKFLNASRSYFVTNG